MSDESQEKVNISAAEFPTSPKIVFVRVGLLVVLLTGIVLYVLFGEGGEDANEPEPSNSFSVNDILGDSQAVREELDIDLEARDD